MDGSPGDVVEVEGVARMRGELALSRATFGGSPHVTERRARFALETPEGSIEIDPPGSLAGALLPLTRTSGTWAEVVTPLLAELQSIAPPPDVRIVVESVAVTEGARVRVRGRVREIGASDAPGDYREAPARRVLAIDAELIAVGEDRARVLEAAVRAARPRRPADPQRVNRRIALGVLIVSFIPLALASFRTATHRPAQVSPALLWCSAIACCQVGIGSWFGIRRMRIRRVMNFGVPFAFAKAMGFAMPVGLGFSGLLALLGIDQSPHGRIDGLGVVILMVVAMAVPVGFAIPLVRERRRLRARLEPGPGWHVIEGTITPALYGIAQKTFTLVHAAGTTEVVLEDAQLAADDHFVDPESQWSLPTIPRGGRVIVAGRASDDGRLAATQPGNLVIWGTHAGGEPRRALDREIRRETMLVVLLGAGLAAAIAVTLAL